MDENKEDQPLSSEELLRRAREGLGEPDDAGAPPPDFSIESYPPPASEPSTGPVYSDDSPSFSDMDAGDTTEPSPPVTPSYEPPSYDPPTYDPPVAESPADPASWAPPPTDSGGEWTAATPGAQEPVRSGSSGRIWIFLAIAVVLGFGAFSLLDNSKTVDDIAVGDCMDIPEEDVFSSVDTIDCNEPHDLEVFGLVDLTALGSSYPGDDPVSEAAFDLCWDEFERYVGVAYEDSAIYMDAFTPTLEGWDERGDRIANCVLYEVDAAETSLIKSQHSLRGANR